LPPNEIKLLADLISSIQYHYHISE